MGAGKDRIRYNGTLYERVSPRRIRVDGVLYEEVLDELFGRKKKAGKGPKTGSANGGPKVERNAFKDQDVKKWLRQSRYVKDLEKVFHSVINSAKVTFTVGNIAVVLFLTNGSSKNAMLVAKGVGKSSIADLWIKYDLYSGNGSWSDVFNAFLKCADYDDVDPLLRKYGFSQHKTH